MTTLSRHDFHRVLQELEGFDGGAILADGIRAHPMVCFAQWALSALDGSGMLETVVHYGRAKYWEGILHHDIPLHANDKRDFFANLGAQLDSFFREDCAERLTKKRQPKGRKQ